MCDLTRLKRIEANRILSGVFLFVTPFYAHEIAFRYCLIGILDNRYRNSTSAEESLRQVMNVRWHCSWIRPLRGPEMRTAYFRSSLADPTLDAHFLHMAVANRRPTFCFAVARSASVSLPLTPQREVLTTQVQLPKKCLVTRMCGYIPVRVVFQDYGTMRLGSLRAFGIRTPFSW